MTDLRNNSDAMQELLNHLLEREGAVDHFYCDHRGLVTIAIGILVDKAGPPEGQGKRLAHELAVRSDVKFSNAAGATATASEVEADWQRVKNHGASQPGLGARAYGAVAQLRIDRATVDAITKTKIKGFLDTLYEKHAFLVNQDSHVAMALIDARYNPAGVVIYGNDPQVQQMWSALDPSHAQFNPVHAIQLFTQIWANHGNDRYAQRHQQRIAWMRAGLGLKQAQALSPH